MRNNGSLKSPTWKFHGNEICSSSFGGGGRVSGGGGLFVNGDFGLRFLKLKKVETLSFCRVGTSGTSEVPIDLAEAEDETRDKDMED